MASNPIVEQRIRVIQNQAADRRSRRADAAAKAAEEHRKSDEFYLIKDEETRQSISPGEVTVRQRHTELVNYYYNLHVARQEQEKAEHRNRDIKTMAELKSEWAAEETTPTRKNVIVRLYSDLYRKYVPSVTAEMTLAYWQKEKKQAVLQKIYGAVRGEQ